MLQASSMCLILFSNLQLVLRKLHSYILVDLMAAFFQSTEESRSLLRRSLGWLVVGALLRSGASEKKEPRICVLRSSTRIDWASSSESESRREAS